MSQIKQMNNNDLNNIQIQSIDYHPNLSKHLFSKIEHLPWSMILRSASNKHIDSRYDILVANPLVKLTTSGDVTNVEGPSGSYNTKQDPFELLAELQSRYIPDCSHDSTLPFLGGSLGYFAYDLGRRVETMPTLAANEVDCPDMAVGLYDWAVIVDHKEKKAWVVGQNVDEHWQWLTNLDTDKENLGYTVKSDFALTTEWQSNMTKQTYQNKFDAIQEYLLSGDCYQINLAQRFHAEYQGSEWQAYEKLEAVNKAPFSAFIRTDDSAVISVSPERFLQVHKGIIETKPIKGTRPRSLDKAQDAALAQDLATAEKDQAENLMIVDLLRNDVGRVAKPGSVHVPKLFDIESFPAVHHLVSTIRAELGEQYQSAELLRASFPGGSITGAPKVRAMEIIEELEPHRRNVYCGSIGYISCHGHMDTSITIRTLLANNQTLYAWAGGGIVADSQSDAEYQETLDKLSKILPTLAGKPNND
ncbi:aminodeoxychorismate synthase component I [Vibrio mexicanus]|uniref:aminodeoxychorismate synthase component I n=1 Tax=Vibrio mexicanus TaxID=1004326 RepID=UPI00063C918A|nr:aminodeoxychorismate synthase component I [Vibrio mexicanus]